MKSLRPVFALAVILVIASFGFVAYMLLAGPERINFAGRSLNELLESGDLVPFIVIPIALVITAAMIPFMRIIFPDKIKNGVEAQARVLKVWDTGVSINDNPQVGLLLEISPAGGNPFQVEAKTVVSRLNAALVQPGITADVRYDPQKPQRLRVLTLHVGSPVPGDNAARLEELESLRDKGLITAEEYCLKREEILKNL